MSVNVKMRKEANSDKDDETNESWCTVESRKILTQTFRPPRLDDLYLLKA